MTDGPPAPGREQRYAAQQLCADPLVLLTATVSQVSTWPVPELARRLGDRPATSLVFVHWTMESGKMAEMLRAECRAVAATYPAHRVIILCNTAREVDVMRADGIEAVHCNHNLLVNEATFDIARDATPEFDAIYVACIRTYKRHALARAIPRLGLIYYGVESAEPGYWESVRAALPHAVFVNERAARAGYGELAHARATALARQLLAAHGYVTLAPPAVAAHLNRAQVGLCLSAREGAMYASMEYLLCGLSVVSTENVGGRDQFLEPDYCITVPPDEAAVAAAVAELQRRAVPRAQVRARTLAKVAAERAKFRSLLAELLAGEGTERKVDEAWRRMTRERWWWRRLTIDEMIRASAEP